MWKRILVGIAFLLAVSAGGQMMLPSEASAQDVWVYTVHDSSYEQGYQVLSGAMRRGICGATTAGSMEGRQRPY